MKKQNLYLIGAITAFALATLLAFGPMDGSHDAVAAGETPAFTVSDLEGTSVSLSDYKGKVVLVNFWATWCPPCRQEIPHFVEMADEIEGLEIIGLSVDQGGQSVVDKWLDANPVNYTMAMASRELYGEWQQYVPADQRGGIPFSFVIDKEGEIRHTIVGYRDKAQWEEMIKPLL